MGRTKLEGLRVAILAADGFEQVELFQPMKELRRQGAVVEVVAPHGGAIKGVNLLVPGKKVNVDETLDNADADVYDALLIPGGLVGPDTLRQSDKALDFVRAFERENKPIAMICHAPWLMVSAGLVRGRALTSWPGIKDDVKNAGGDWLDKASVRDGNWISSRGPQDMKQFKKAMVGLFSNSTPMAPKEIESDGPPTGRWLLFGLIMAGVAYVLRRDEINESLRKQLS